MGTSSIGFESTWSTWTGGVFVQLCQRFTSLVWNLGTFEIFHAGGVDMKIMGLLSCGNTDGPQLSSRLLLRTVLFQVVFV